MNVKVISPSRIYQRITMERKKRDCLLRETINIPILNHLAAQLLLGSITEIILQTNKKKKSFNISS